MLAVICTGLVLFSQTASPLDAEPALNQKITIETPGETITEFVAQIRDKTGAKIDASAYVADDFVILRASDLPAKEVLQKVAIHLGWEWERDEMGTHLRISNADRSRETEALRSLTLQPYVKWRNEARENLKAGLPGDTAEYVRLGKEEKDLQDRYDAEYIHGEVAARKGWSENFQRVLAAREVLARRLSPGYMLSDTLAAGLTDAQLLALDQDRKVVFSYSPTQWQSGMPTGAAKIAEKVASQVALSSQPSATGGTDLDQINRDLGLQANEKFTLDDVGTVRVAIRAENRRYSPEGQIGVWDRVVILSKSGKVLSQASFIQRNPRVLPEVQKKEIREKDRFDEPLTQTDRLKDAMKPSERGDQLKCVSEAWNEFLKPKSTTHPLSGYGKTLISIADAANLNVISDCYDLPFQPSRKGWKTSTLRTAFDGFAKGLDQEWNAQGNWVTFRQRGWQLARTKCAKAKPLFEVAKLVSDSTVLPFDRLAGIASRTTDFQSTSQLFGKISQAVAGREVLYSQRDVNLYVLRLWGSLSSRQRAVCEAGGGVVVSSLTSAQRGLVAAILYRLDDRGYSTMIRPGTLEEEDGAWIQKNWPEAYSDDEYSGDHETTQVLPTGVPSTALITFHLSTGNALVISNSQGWTGTMTEQFAVTGGYYQPGGSEFTARPTKEFRMYFGAASAPAFGRGLELAFTQLNPEGEYMSYDKFAPEIQERLRKAYEEYHKGG